jgi:SpoVK/Ycf46/Vps4 family AAA+-type ATPase
MQVNLIRSTFNNNYSNKLNNQQNKLLLKQDNDSYTMRNVAQQRSFIGFAGGSGFWQKKQQTILEATGAFVERTVSKIQGHVSKDDTARLAQVGGSLEEVRAAYNQARENVGFWGKNKQLRELTELQAGAEGRILGQMGEIVTEQKNDANEATRLAAELHESLAAQGQDKAAEVERHRKIADIHAAQAGKSEKTGFARIAGYRDVQVLFDKHFVDQIKAEKRGAEVNIPGSVLFFGPTGTGKTTFTKGFAEATECPLVKLSITPNLSSAEREKKFLNKLNDEAEKAKQRFSQDRTRTVLFVDEIDKVAGKGSTITSALQKFMETCSESHHCTLFASTNHPSRLGIDMANDKIFPHRISIAPPNKENATQVFQHHLSGMTSQKINHEELAHELIKHGESQGKAYSNRQIEELCNETHEQKGANFSQADILESLKRKEPKINNKSLIEFNDDVKKYTPEN